MQIISISEALLTANFFETCSGRWRLVALLRAGEREPEAGGRVSGSDVCRGSEDRRSLLLEEGQDLVIVGGGNLSM